MVAIKNDLEAYMFDEVCRFYEKVAEDGDGYNFSRIKWIDRSQTEIQKGNRSMMDHISRNS